MNVSERGDLVAGLVVALLGGGLAWMAHAGYPLGTLRRMGPGMFPFGLGLTLAVLGAALALTAWLRARRQGARPNPEPAHRIQWRAMVLTLFGVVAFALLIQRAGLIPAAVVVVAVSAFADTRNTVLSVLVLSLALCALAIGVFKLALGMTFHLFIWPF